MQDFFMLQSGQIMVLAKEEMVINLDIPSWVGIVSIVFHILTLYFVLSFIENLHKDDERIAKQSKIVAMICLIIALLFPALYSFIYF